MSLEKLIIKAIEASSGNNLTQKDLFKKVKNLQQQTSINTTTGRDCGDDTSSSAFEKKAAKKVLKKLVKSGTITLVDSEAKLYSFQSLLPPSSVPEFKSKDTKSQSLKMVNREEMNQSQNNTPLPFAESLRQRKRGRPVEEEIEMETMEEENEDIDEEIRRLEAELAADSDSSSGTEDDDYGEDEEEHVNPSDGETSDAQKAGVISLSKLATDRIAALPHTNLPTNKRRILKNVDKDSVRAPSPSPKRRKNKGDESSANGSTSNISDGLRAAVKEVLDGYKPRSNEKIPFYCRVCAKQYKNGDEFFEHKKGDFHKAAVELEKKASYCKLCRKQLTSPVQLKEHLHSKPHKERLRLMKSRQPPRER